MQISSKMTGRDIFALVCLIFVLIWTALIIIDINNPQEKYKKNKLYCLADYDCQVVYDLVNSRCYTVNLLHKDKYETDVTCRRRTAVCLKHKCNLP